MAEKRVRSVVKGFTWRLFATLDTVLIAWLITNQLKFALSIGGIEVVTKVGLYYLHERAWNKIKLGKNEEQIEYNI